MSPARAHRLGSGRRGGPRFRRLVDAWQGDRRERTPMSHGTRVASIEAQLGADMTPGRDARWEHLPLVDPEVELEDQLFRTSLEDVVPADTPDREALVERAVDVARDRFFNHGEVTRPEQALDLAHHQAQQDHTSGPERGHDPAVGPENQHEDVPGAAPEAAPGAEVARPVVPEVEPQIEDEEPGP